MSIVTYGGRQSGVVHARITSVVRQLHAKVGRIVFPYTVTQHEVEIVIQECRLEYRGAYKFHDGYITHTNGSLIELVSTKAEGAE